VDELKKLKNDINAAGLELEAIENFDPANWYDVLRDGPMKEKQIADLKQMASNSKSSVPWHHRLETVSIAATSDVKLKKGGRPRKKKD